MSGLEVPALIFGIVSAVAGTTSAIKDVSERRHESSLYKSEKTIRVRPISVGIVLKADMDLGSGWEFSRPPN